MRKHQSFQHLGIGTICAALWVAATPLHAAPSMAHDTCRVIGKVTSVETKEFKRNMPRSWLDDWKLSNSYTETVIKLDISTIEILKDIGYDKDSCTLEKAAEGYYLRDKKFFKGFGAGDCISAETNFSGDEFRIGNWIYNIETLPADQCRGATRTNDEQTKEEKEAK